jgi:putative hydroxymethylpyrimidine transport system substrate-binding protein
VQANRKCNLEFKVRQAQRLKNRTGIIASLFAVAIAVAGCGSPTGAGAPPATHVDHLTLWLDYTPWGAHVPIYVARARGYFAAQGLDVSIRIPSNVTDPLKLVADNPNTLGIGYMSDVVTAESKGIPVMSVAALVQHHLNCIMTLKSSHITSPKQLAGKKIGAAETPADSVILDTVFKHAGVTGKVQRVNVNYDYVPALLTHRVDAIEGGYQVWERIEIEQAGQKVNVIQLQNWGVPDEYELVLLGGRSLVKNHPSVVKRFDRALSEAVAYSVKNPNAAVNTFLKANTAFNTAKDKQLVHRSWRLLIPFYQPKGVRFGTQTTSRWHGLASWMFKQKLVTKLVPNRQLFTNRFIG